MAAAALLVVLLPESSPARALSAPSSETLAAISLLHQGRFDAAAAAFAVISKRKPGDPEGPFFEAFVSWWRLLDQPKNRDAQRDFEAQLQEGIRRSEALLDGPEAAKGRLFAGTSYILSAQSRAFTGNYFSAGTAAKQGHRHLETLLADDPGAADAWFALGAYKYFAAKIPVFARALGSLLRIPGGNEEEGIAGLKKAAASGGHFRVEASLLLTHIYADQEEDYRSAVENLAAARSIEPTSPLLSAIEGRLQYGLGHLRAAEDLSRESLDLSSRGALVAPAIVTLARIRLALALYYQYRPMEAATELRPLLKPGIDLPEGAAATIRGLAERLSGDLADDSLAKEALAALADGRTEEKGRVAAAPAPLDAAAAFEKMRGGEPVRVIESLSTAMDKDPNDPVTRYHLARAYEAAGRREEAVSALQKCLGAGPRLPKTLQGWAMIRMGVALQAEGKNPEAEGWYHRAADLKGFLFRRAALDRLKHPEGQLPPEG